MAQATLQSALVIAGAGGPLSNLQGLDAALESVTVGQGDVYSDQLRGGVWPNCKSLTQLEQYTRINGSHANGLDYVPV